MLLKYFLFEISRVNIKLNQLNREPKHKVFVKMKFLNPGNSAKNRIGITMIEETERLTALVTFYFDLTRIS